MSRGCPAGNHVVTKSMEIYLGKLGKQARGSVFFFFFFGLADIRIKQVIHIATVVHIQGAIFTTVRAGFSFLSLKESLSSD